MIDCCVKCGTHLCPQCSVHMFKGVAHYACIKCGWEGDLVNHYKAELERIQDKPCYCKVHRPWWWFMLGVSIGVMMTWLSISFR